ncbi:aromatic-ring hydroxylase C-terminal domain-containing protein [Yinghuangia aomiensis]
MVRGSDGARVSLLDLYESRFVLLTGAGEAGELWRRAAETVGGPVEVFAVGAVADGAPDGLATEGDVDWATLHGVSAEGAVLVRPDGVRGLAGGGGGG